MPQPKTEPLIPLASIGRYLPRVVAALLVIVIAGEVAEIARRFATNRSATLPTVVAPPVVLSQPEVSADLSGLRESHLFGEAPPETAPVVDVAADVPDTTLAVTLMGTLLGKTETDDQAIISSAGEKERTYHVGESIDDANGATLHAVGVDRILLRRGDRLEALYLAKAQDVSHGSFRRPPELSPRPQAGDFSDYPAAQDRGARLSQFLGLAPRAQDGGVVGLRFAATGGADFGLQAGDIVTDIHGSTDGDGEDHGAPELLNVTVVSNGVPRVVVIAPNEVGSLRANLQ